MLPCPDPDGMWMESKKIRKAVSMLIPMNPNASMYARRTDFEVTNHHILILNEAVTARSYQTAFIRTAINLPAHSFYQTLPSLLPLLQSIPIVIFHCNSCSPGGRGPRTAAWYQDALDIQGIKSSHAVILASGVKGWIARYEEDTNLTVKLT